MAGKRKKQGVAGRALAAVYPASPCILGLDWLELTVRHPVRTAATYEAIGFTLRGRDGSRPRLSVGGTMLVLHGARGSPGSPGSPRSPNPPNPSGLSKGTKPRPEQQVRIQLVVDDVGAKRRQLIHLGLKPGPLRRQSRGDWVFEWRDPDGHAICFVGPTPDRSQDLTRRARSAKRAGLKVR